MNVPLGKRLPRASFRRDREPHPAKATLCQHPCVKRFDVTPEQASHGRVVPERELPNLAAQWLADGYDSPLLRLLASMNSHEVLQGEVRFADVLAELGFPQVGVGSPYEDIPWRGNWEGIWWAVARMDQTHSPYASAQYVLEIIGDYEGLWEPGGGDLLMNLLERWKDDPNSREEVNDQLRAHLRSLREDDVPPLR